MWRVAVLVIVACDSGPPPIERLPAPAKLEMAPKPPPPPPPPSSGWNDTTIADATGCTDGGEIQYGSIDHGHVRFCTAKTCWDVDEHGEYRVKVGTVAANRTPLHDGPTNDLQFPGRAALYTDKPESKAMLTAGPGGLLVAGEGRVFAIRRDHSMDELDETSRVLRPFQQDCAPPITAWHDELIINKIASPSCPRHPDRHVHYAALVGNAIRFCTAWTDDIGCWSVDVATGQYRRVGGVAIVAQFPMPESNGVTSTRVTGHGTIEIDHHVLRYHDHDDTLRGGIEVPGEGGVMIGDGESAYVVDRDGVIYGIPPTPAPTFLRTLHPPPCSAD
ncbi:MAG: hypothetical protein QM831_36550 [Kofleriaceae bacterium]